MAFCRLACLWKPSLIPRAGISGPSSSYVVTLALTLKSSLLSALRPATVGMTLFNAARVDRGPGGRSFLPATKTYTRTRRKPPLPSRNLLFPSHENSSFRPRFSCRDFPAGFAAKRLGNMVSLRSIATYSWDLGYGGDKQPYRNSKLNRLICVYYIAIGVFT